MICCWIVKCCLYTFCGCRSVIGLNLSTVHSSLWTLSEYVTYLAATSVKHFFLPLGVQDLTMICFHDRACSVFWYIVTSCCLGPSFNPSSSRPSSKNAAKFSYINHLKCTQFLSLHEHCWTYYLLMDQH